MTRTRVLIRQWLPDGMLGRLRACFPHCEFVESSDPAELASAEILYGPPPLDRLEDARLLRWIQLASAGVPPELCPFASRRGIQVTNMAGLYGPGIADHAIGLLAMLVRHLHLARDNQPRQNWDRSIMANLTTMADRTMAIVGVGSIGQAVARQARAHGMRVIGCCRRPRPRPWVDWVFPMSELHAMLREADVVCVALPHTVHTENLLGPEEFAAMKPGSLYLNVSRGGVAREEALVEALRSGRIAGAGLDVTAIEPLPEGNPLWTMPQVILSPHISGESVNFSPRPAARLARNLEAWLGGQSLEAVVDLEWGY